VSISLLTSWRQPRETLGKITSSIIAFQTRPDPNNPAQMQIGIAMGGAAQFLVSQGIILNVSITVDNLTADAMRAQGRPLPTPVNCPALVDTGASGLALDTTVIQQLGLMRKGITSSATAAGLRDSPVYFVSLEFPGTDVHSYPLLRATEVNLQGQRFKCLIGRETMANWHLHYNGQSGQVSIAD
jgi:predicted aspartyl protease